VNLCDYIPWTVITINNPHSAVNFNWRDSFGSDEFSHGTLLVSHGRVLSAGCQFMHNSNTTSLKQELTAH